LKRRPHGRVRLTNHDRWFFIQLYRDRDRRSGRGAGRRHPENHPQQAAQGTKNVSDNIAGVSVGADAGGAAAQNVKTASEMLGVQTQQLRGQVDAFVGKIRAA
jgi:hypothetical protein